tara:strand:- start:1222 stop:1614 length:393 start_codon:yes stop_codon:yes gene_type:complete
MSAAEEITDDEFQFYKQELQKNVKEYLQLGDELDALKKAAKERAATKKEVTEKIIDLMKKIDITHLNIKEGRLGTKTTKVTKAVTNKHLHDTLGQIFKGDDVAVTQALTTILNTREQTERVELKHYKKKL